MQASPKPHVLIVDDEPDTQRPFKTDLEHQVDITVIHPDDVTKEDLSEADLALIDFRIEDWPKREEVDPIALKPLNGLALAAILRGHAETLTSASPTAFAIYSAHLRELSGGLPPESHEHIIARLNNLEWAFSKVSAGSSSLLAQQMMSLASAVRRLPPAWPQNKPEATREIAGDLLALSFDISWSDRAWEDIEACHPPLHELSEASHGLAFLRWFLHRIIPYPCFLWDTHYLAARLRVTYESFQNALKENNELNRLLDPFKYHGILSDFLGPRWWRTGIEAFLWNLTDGSSFDPDSIRSEFTSRIGFELAPVPYIQPVVCLDQNYRALPNLHPIEDAVRIQPDDWPPYADQAWTTIELAREEPSLLALLISQDRERLG